ncbi:MAG TPA: hypothetical protein VNO14_00305 [Blastocatellia bacterium]|nr:hypothetical protein [Blastocatellia bacterium]
MKKQMRFSRYMVIPLALMFLLAGSSMLADNGANHRVRNLHFGVSGGNVNDITRRFCCSGTLGALVQDSNGTQYILSNNHVMGLSGRARPGDDISQPGLIDNNCDVATVVADFTVAPPLSQNVDCAIAQLRPGQMDGTGFIEDIGTISSTVQNPAIGLAVQKSGRTTGHTTGTISSINTTVSVRYPKKCGSGGGTVFTFVNQVVVGGSSFSAGGDSGSLIVTNTGDGCAPRPVALLFAGSSTATIGNPVGQVLSRLSASLGRTVSFVGSACASAPELGLRAEGLSRQDIERVSMVKERNENRIMSQPSVIGMGVGVSDENPAEAVIVVYVNQHSGTRSRLPENIDGVRVKVVQTDEFVAY